MIIFGRLTALIVLISCSAHAQIVSFSNAALGAGNTSAATTVSATALDAGFSSAIVARGADLSNGSGTARFNSDSWTTVEGTATNDYISVTLNPNAGYQYTISQITFTVGSSSNINNWSIRSSLDNYDSQIASGTFAPNSTSAVSITGTSLNGFSNLSSTTQFRIYAWGASATGSNTFGIGNGAPLSIAGTVAAVPEPATCAAIVGALALVGVAIHRRRRASTSGSC